MTQLELFPNSSPANVSNSALPDYQVRESSRAKRVSLRISVEGDVEVVIPPKFDRSQIPALIEKRRDWIIKNRAKLLTTRTVDNWREDKPDTIELRSQQETWQVVYEKTADPGAICLPVPGKKLKVRGDVDSIPICQAVLQQWLSHRAQRDLVPWLRQVSFAIDLPFKQASVRGQKTRWASCSSRKDISLNYKLLFLPTDLVEYVLVHELCHTIHMNHSKRFWALVGEKQPDYGPRRQAIKKGWTYVPRWAEG
ncbi:MAG: SprT family zinc-dependent metalloprotease [Cyanobacteria bacterium P01_A01_bin.137]